MGYCIVYPITPPVIAENEEIRRLGSKSNT